MFSPVGSLADKLRVLRLRNRVTTGPVESVLERPEKTALSEFRESGFSEAMIERFFRPFFAGIFLERELSTSSRKFDFIFRMFSEGHAALPARGMQAIPEQLAARLAEESLAFDTLVTSLHDGVVTTARGDRYEASQIVLAVGQSEALKL